MRKILSLNQTRIFMTKQHSKKSRRHKREFPKITRFITEGVGKEQTKQFLSAFGVVTAIILIVLIALQLLSVYGHYKEKERLQGERTRLRQEVLYWQDIVGKYKDYRDGYYNIALLSYRLGEDKKAWDNLQKALILDPNFEPARTLESLFYNAP